MGTWGVSEKELIEKLTDCLDEVEGDFDSETLVKSLEFLKFYCPTSDSTEALEKLWKKKLKALREIE